MKNRNFQISQNYILIFLVTINLLLIILSILLFTRFRDYKKKYEKCLFDSDDLTSDCSTCLKCPISTKELVSTSLIPLTTNTPTLCLRIVLPKGKIRTSIFKDSNNIEYIGIYFLETQEFTLLVDFINADYMVVGGGGAGGSNGGGGGGGGGVRVGKLTIAKNKVHRVEVGNGGDYTPYSATDLCSQNVGPSFPFKGKDSKLITDMIEIIAEGGGSGGCGQVSESNMSLSNGLSGGCGGGGGSYISVRTISNHITTDNASGNQGGAGGKGVIAGTSMSAGGGGGGGGGRGYNAQNSGSYTWAGKGGLGYKFIDGQIYAGGGGGGKSNVSLGWAGEGSDGGGNGGMSEDSYGYLSFKATLNTGGGGGGGGYRSPGGSGGSGIVIIAVPTNVLF